MLAIDSQAPERLSRIIQFRSEITDVEFIHAGHIHAQVVFSCRFNRSQHAFHRFFHSIAISTQHLLCNREISLLAKTR